MAIQQSGAWTRAGLAGLVTGIDIDAALVRIDTTGLDDQRLRLLIARAEPGLLAGILKTQKKTET